MEALQERLTGDLSFHVLPSDSTPPLGAPLPPEETAHPEQPAVGVSSSPSS